MTVQAGLCHTWSETRLLVFTHEGPFYFFISIYTDKRHRTLAELLFKRSPTGKKPSPTLNKGSNLELSSKGVRYINRKPEPQKQKGPGESVKTRNAVYCAIVMEEFVKELAALSQEHAVLNIDDDGYSSC